MYFKTQVTVATTNFEQVSTRMSAKVAETTGVKYHLHLDKIRNYSTMVDFILRLQPVFFDKFREFKDNALVFAFRKLNDCKDF